MIFEFLDFLIILVEQWVINHNIKHKNKSRLSLVLITITTKNNLKNFNTNRYEVKGLIIKNKAFKLLK